MQGQPNVPPWLVFEVTNLEIFEPPPLTPSTIVPVNGPFTLRASFQGSGIIWEWLKNLNVQFQVFFSADGFGANAPEYDLGMATGTLMPGTNAYQANFPYAGIPIAGVYEVACLVKFPNLPGLTGFVAPLMIEVY